VDQELTTGNQGYLVGNAPPVDESARRKTRQTYVAEVELASPKPKKAQPVAPEVAAGNQGFVEGTPEVQTEEAKPVEPTMVQYQVKKNDTLQKISKQFFGTTKKWNKIYQLNQSRIKNPDRIRPGMVLDIPKE
jgi:nucleoid-associated protein YgaU